MTHYMELLAVNQPWNLIIYMAIPVILAETVAVTELYILFTKNSSTWVGKLNRIASILVGFYFTGIFVYLFTTAFIPLTLSGSWRGGADVIAVSAYLLGVVPLLGLAFLELGIPKKTKEEKMKLHAVFVGAFLIIAHIAMIFGMLNPEILGYTPQSSSNTTTNMSHDNMGDMNMGH